MSENNMTTQDVSSVEKVNQPRPVHWASPAVDIYETGEHLVLEADLPGVREEDLQLEVSRGVLTLEAPASAENGRQYGFYRQFRISDRIDADAGEAALKDGVLRLRLPKSEAAKPKKISVKTVH